MQQGVEAPEAKEQSEEDVGTLKKQIDQSIGEHRTSASMINAVVGGVSTKGKILPVLNTAQHPGPHIAHTTTLA